MKSVNLKILVYATAFMLLSIKLSNFFLPDRMYFSFSSFLYGSQEILRLPALVAKLLVPFASAAVFSGMTLWYYRRAVLLGADRSRIEQVQSDQLELTITTAGFMTAFLLAWPYIILWDVLISVHLNDFRLVFLIAYVLYFMAFAYLARSGHQVAVAISEKGFPKIDYTSRAFLDHPIVKPVVSSVGGILAATISSFLIQTTAS